MDYKPTVVFDFDGVIHSYVSGWKGADVIPDLPVPGIWDAIDKIRDAGNRVVVVSTRCSNPYGMGAVRKYLKDNGIVVDDVMAEKPPAVCYIDDRAIRFDGNAAALPEKVAKFKSWVEGAERNDEPVKNLRPCKAVEYNRGVMKEVTGRFHRWGEAYEEFETGPGNQTNALIELDDGRIVECMAWTVQFLDREECERSVT